MTVLRCLLKNHHVSCPELSQEHILLTKVIILQKGLIGIAPHGAVTSVVSELCGVHCSDKAIVEDCGILQLLQEGDSVMADRGFEIQDLLAKKKVYLNIPPFMRCKDQLSPEKEDETRDGSFSKNPCGKGN